MILPALCLCAASAVPAAVFSPRASKWPNLKQKSCRLSLKQRKWGARIRHGRPVIICRDPAAVKSKRFAAAAATPVYLRAGEPAGRAVGVLRCNFLAPRSLARSLPFFGPPGGIL